MTEIKRFVDHHVIEIDLDPETERNIRHHERNLTLDDVLAALISEVAHPGPGLYGEDIEIVVARLRPGTPND